MYVDFLSVFFISVKTSRRMYMKGEDKVGRPDTSPYLHAMKCCLMISTEDAPLIDCNIQSRTVRAFNIVSAVVIVLETTTTKVDSASRPRIQINKKMKKNFICYLD